MTSYRFLWADLLTGEVQGEVPLESASFGWILNAPGPITLTLPLRPNRPDKVATLTESTFAPGRTSLFVLRDNVPLWGGILWTVSASVEDNTLVAEGEGFLSYFRKRFLKVSKDYEGVEQTAIATDLLEYALAQPGGSIPVTMDATATGVTRDRSFHAFERKNIGEAVEQLSQVRDGFDFRFEPYWDGNTLAARFVTSYPQTGRPTNYVLELGSNVELLALTNDATTMANSADAFGGGDGPDIPYRNAVDTSVLSSYPLLEDVVSHSDVTVGATLKGYAEARLDKGRRPIKIPTVRLTKTAIPGIGDYVVGDRVRVKGTHGYLSVDDTFRITGLQVGLTTEGDEQADLTLAPLGAFSQ